MKSISCIYLILFLLIISKQTVAMEEKENENTELQKLLTTCNTIKQFKENILDNKIKRKAFLRILSRPYSQKKLNLSLFDINWDIGNLTYDANEGYKTSAIGGMQMGLVGMLMGKHQSQMGADNNIKFFKSQEITDVIINFFETIQLRKINKNSFFEVFSKKDTLDLYRNTYFFHYILHYCAKLGTHSMITQKEMNILEKHLQKEIVLQVIMKVLLVSGTYLTYKTITHIIRNYTEPFFDNLKNKKALNMLVHEINPLKEKTKSTFFEKVFLPEKLKIFFRDFKAICENPLTKEHKHLIFFGPPGTAKTMIAVKFATEELRKKAIIVNAGMLTSLKNPSGALKNIFEQKNAIIIFDEIESLLSLESLKHELLTYLQNGSGNKSPLVFATTNIVDIQDKFPSLCRPGRFNPVLVNALQNESDIKLFTDMILKEYNIALDTGAEEYLLRTMRAEKDITGARIKNILLCAKELSERNTTKKSSLDECIMKIKTLWRKKEIKSPIILTKELLIKALNFYSMNLQ